MKKINLFRIINLVLISTYVVSLIVEKTLPIFNLTLAQFWFPTLCLLLGFSMLFKSIIFKSDSSLWLFVCLVLVSISLYCIYILNLDWATWWVLSLSIVSIASVTVGLVFKEVYQIKVASNVMFVSVPLYLWVFNVINVWVMVALLVVAIWLSLIWNSLLPERWYANKK